MGKQIEPMSTFAALKNKLKEAREATQKAAKEAFSETAKQIFNDHPGLESFSWTQYTPYFNDGDPCVFRCHAKYGADIEFEGKEYGDNSEESFDDLPPAGQVKIKAADKIVADFLKAFDDEDYEAMFGDHVKVTVTKKGATTEDCDHD